MYLGACFATRYPFQVLVLFYFSKYYFLILQTFPFRKALKQNSGLSISIVGAVRQWSIIPNKQTFSYSIIYLHILKSYKTIIFRCIFTINNSLTVKNKYLICVLIGLGLYLSLTCIAFSQFNRTKNWVLGDSVLLDFSSNPPTLGISGLRSYEGLSVISDLNGTLLFYTNGITVWNAQHQPMPNGLGLNSDLSSSDAALIVPLPGSSHIYYIFTVGIGDSQPLGSIFCGVAYSVVDMSLHGGLGDVTQKNVVIHPSPLSTEKLCATQHANGMDYWIMTHDYSNNQFRAFLLTSNGVQPNPVVSKIGMRYVNYKGLFGNMRFSPSGCKLAVSLRIGALDTVEVFDFDKSTGYVHNLIQLNFLGGWGQWGELPEDYPNDLEPYGVCFSPDNTKLYISAPSTIMQFDLASNDPQLIQQSRYPVAQSIGTSYYFSSMQIGADGKIYIARPSASFVSTINSPNSAGAACGFVASGIAFSGLKSKHGLPNFVSNFLVPDSVSFSSCNPYCPELNLGKDTILCSADSFLIAVDLPKGTILWNHLDTSFDFTVTYSGEYFAAYDFNGCPTQYDTIRVSFVQNPLPVYADTVFCKGDTLYFTLTPNDSIIYTINNEIVDSIWKFYEPETYTIKAQIAHCAFSQSFQLVDTCSAFIDTFSVEIPNVFTPNNDGENDVFTIQQTMVRELTFVIYNRWGKVVHSAKILPTQKEVLIWDGENASDGTYFYTATLIDWKYQMHEKKGFILLFR